VQAEFERHVQFALDLARSAPDPGRTPESHLGNKPANFVVDKFAVSYGNPQTCRWTPGATWAGSSCATA
jgi:hypothetical protein